MARERVLARMVAAGIVTPEDAEFARRKPCRRRGSTCRYLPRMRALTRARPVNTRLTIDRSDAAGGGNDRTRHANALGPQISVAVMIADHRNGEILARVGSAVAVR